jgi:hypothetical protein
MFSVELEVQRCGGIAWRNNSGELRTADGRVVRFGLGNVSRRLNDVLKSSDYIGIMEDGRFLALEVKPEGWRYRGTDHERAQLAFLRLVADRGGVAGFVTCAADVVTLCKQKRP